MPNISPELLKEAFIDPIRFALVVDDEFPTYSQMARQELERYDAARAESLFGFCRAQGWLCDVDNAVRVAEEFERDKHLNQSDLLILDFHLESDKPEDPTRALGVLQSLAASDHFNLVIIYTAAPPADVARDVAYSLGGGVRIAEADEESVSDFIDELDPDVYENILDSSNREVIQNFLSSKRLSDSSRALVQSLRDANINPHLISSAVAYICKEQLAETLSVEVIGGRRASANVEVSFSNDGPMWVAEGNLFAVIVNKQEAVNVLLQRLESALVSWNPSPLKLMMIQARAALEKAGTTVDLKVLDTPRRQAGWLLRVLSATDLAERKRHIHELYGRLFERLIKHVDEMVIGFGSKLFLDSEEAPAKIAREMAKATGVSDEDIYHALNEHLCSDSYTDGIITTGVVFRCKREDSFSYWLCASPACDLVIGQNENGWDGDLHPYRPINAIRLTPVNGLRKRLENATHGRDIFLHVDGVSVVLEVADSTTRQMKMETLLLANGGAIESSVFAGLIIALDGDRNPGVVESEFQSVALLRSDYANKFLAESGYQRARIGVDFIPIPKHG
ncbi:response regulator receiver domain [Pseudomonas marginalis]